MEPAARHSDPPSGVSVVVCERPPDWQAFLAARGRDDIYHDSRWGQILRRSYGNRPYYLTAFRDDGIAGVLTLVEKRGPVFAHHLCGMPYFDAVGVVSDDAGARSALLAEARRLRRRRGAAYVELRQRQPLGPSLPTRTDKVAFWLDLPADGEALWQALSAKVRNQVRKAEKAGAASASGGAELLDAFHAVYVRNMRDLGSPPHSRGFFRRILRMFGQAVGLHVVRLGGRAVAASLTLRDAAAVHVPWAASDWRYRRECPNYLLYWTMLREACGRVRRFDFGRSTRGAGTHAFKKHWGGREVPLYWHYLLAPGAKPPASGPGGRAQQATVACWKRLPVAGARALGPWLIGQLS